MKQTLPLLLLLALFTPISHAGEVAIAARIIERISSELAPRPLTLYARTPFERKIIQHSNKMKLAHECQHADLLLLNSSNNIPEECQEKMIFFTRYQPFKQHKNGIAALFWQKGRINIIFSKKRLVKFKITLPKEWQKFIEDTL